MCGSSAAGTRATGWRSRSSTTRSGKPCALVVAARGRRVPGGADRALPRGQAGDRHGPRELPGGLPARGRRHAPRPHGRDGRGADGRPATTTSPRCGSSPRARRPSSSAAARRPRCSRSRARVIEAADAERRRVGRDLHDGAQQRLLPSRTCSRSPSASSTTTIAPAGVLRLACDELGEAQTELRDLARGLHPVALSERGLRNALESLTVGSRCAVTLDVDGGRAARRGRARRLLHRQRVAHQRAQVRRRRRVRVRVAAARTALLVEIADDGRGGADPASGTGLRGLADRSTRSAARSRSTARPARAPASARACRCRGRAESRGAVEVSVAAVPYPGALRLGLAACGLVAPEPREGVREDVHRRPA